MSTSLTPHPRLYLGPAEIARLRQPPGAAVVAAAQTAVRSEAEAGLGSTEFPYDLTTHNAHLIRARIMQRRVVTLAVEFLAGGERRFLDAAVRHVLAMDAWEYWSWITWRQGDARPEAIFDLSYGENSATLALAYDLLFPHLDAAERARWHDIAQRRALRPFLAQVGDPKTRMWWFGKADCNWNTVCAGGAGMLALAMYEELPEAAQVLELAEASIGPFMRHLEATDGGWEEGVGYWNYGMRYAFMYLLSHERATGRAHPLLEQPGTRATLAFPLDFAPQGASAGFSDANHWAPLPFHVAAARRLGAGEVLVELLRLLENAPEFGAGAWPNAAEMLLLHPRETQPLTAPPPAGPRVRLYPCMDWAVLADRHFAPRLCCTVRGGTTEVPHGQRDLLSYNLVVGDEALILNPASGGYLDTTFSPRRNELYETTPAAKNVPLVNGVGITVGSRVTTTRVSAGGRGGIRLDATEAMGATHDGAATAFCGRLFLLLADGRALLVLDRIVTRHPALFETRLHTWAKVRQLRSGVHLQGARQQLRLAVAASVPLKFLRLHDPLTWPVPPSALLRWIADGLHTDVLFAVVAAPGRERVTAQVLPAAPAGGFTVKAAGTDWSDTVCVDARMNLA